jgi:myo-inositol-1(or 4)-monophosphatase
VTARPGRWAGELAFALGTAEQAGAVLMDRYERLERVRKKSPRDVVTEADHLSEALIHRAVRARFPGDGFLGEETGGHGRRDGSAATDLAGRTWVADPLDGTVNYANGIPFFCVAIALVADGRPVVGVVRDPTRGESFAATADGPATLNGRRIRVSEKEQLADLVVSLHLSGRAVATRVRAVRRAVRITRSMGAAALALAYVANGRFDAFAQQSGLSVWDIAAAGLIAERGGAIVTDLGGQPWFDLSRPEKGLAVLAAPSAHYAALLDLAR